MAIVERLRRFLEERHVGYRVLPHVEVFTAQEVAERTHIAGRRLAKVVVVKDQEGRHLMAVLPATQHLDLEALGLVSGRRGLTVAPEKELDHVFPDCERGAMPPFGNLYGMEVYLSACLPRTEELAFAAGNHHEVVQMDCRDFERLVKPQVVEVCAEEALHR
jgi:Ala-tRNA(Pro) deacylase